MYAPHDSKERRLGDGRLLLVRGLVPAAMELDRRRPLLMPPLLLQLCLALSSAEAGTPSAAPGFFLCPLHGELGDIESEDDDEEGARVHDQGE